MSQIEIRVPDIGGAENVDLIEILVKPGDVVAKEDSIATLEGDKASMEVPAPKNGIVDSIQAKVGDQVSQGSLLMTFKVNEDSAQSTESPADASIDAPTVAAAATSPLQALVVPDVGSSDAVDVIEVHVSIGDTIEKDAPLVTLESDKASMEVPSEFAGTLDSVCVKVGDKVPMGE